MPVYQNKPGIDRYLVPITWRSDQLDLF